MEYNLQNQADSNNYPRLVIVLELSLDNKYILNNNKAKQVCLGTQYIFKLNNLSGKYKIYVELKLKSN